MTERAVVCPQCRQLNGPSEARCFRCGAPLRGLGASLVSASRTEFLATKLLIGLCGLNFLVMVLVGRGVPIELLGRGPSPSAIVQVGGISRQVGASVEIYRWLSAVYVHLGVLHLLMNMSALLWLGRTLEESLGRWRMVTIFVLSGIGGFYASRVYFGPISPPTAGASGALFGLLGARVAEMRFEKDPRLKDFLLQYAAYAVAFALLWRVNNAAHLGGFVFGYVLAEGLLRVPRRVSWDRLGNALAVALLALSAASQIAAYLSPASAQVRRIEHLIQGLPE